MESIQNRLKPTDSSFAPFKMPPGVWDTKVQECQNGKEGSTRKESDKGVSRHRFFNEKTVFAVMRSKIINGLIYKK